MIAKLVQISDKTIINSVHQILRNNAKKYQDNIEKNLHIFEETYKDHQDQYVYGVLFNNNGMIIMISSLFLQYKLSRGLSQIYHLQIIYKNCTLQQQLFFQEKIVNMLPGYKITGLNVTESNIFHPHQTFMQFDVALQDQIKSKL